MALRKDPVPIKKLSDPWKRFSECRVDAQDVESVQGKDSLPKPAVWSFGLIEKRMEVRCWRTVAQCQDVGTMLVSC